MRLLCLTDLHGSARALEHILRDAGHADVILFGGDITNFGTPNQAEYFVQCARKACPQVLAVAGNCDSAAIDARLVELGVALFGRGVAHDGVGFCGLSAMPPWQGTMYEMPEADLAAALQAGWAALAGVATTVLLSHTPPRDTPLDVSRRKRHVGSTAVRQFVDDMRPALVVCGHIHEARGVARRGATLIVNCGTARDGHYAVADVGQEVQVELRKAGDGEKRIRHRE